MRIPMMLAAAAALLAAPAARAETVEVTSTTLLNVAKQTRGGVPGQDWDLATVAPAFELMSISARDLANPVADDLTLVLSTWGSYEIRDRRWDNGTTGDLTGDLVTGYLSGKLAGRRLTLRLGRAQIQAGAARMIHLDGGEAIAALPGGVRISAYAGVPVSQRFATRAGYRNWNPLGGDFAYGGRVGWALALPGTPGRGLDLGVSANIVEDGGDPVRQEVAADLRLIPSSHLTFTGFGAYSVYDQRPSEVTLRLGWTPARKLLLELDGRYFAPDLFLSRESILSVFSAEDRHSLGAGVTYRFGRGLSVHGAYHLEIEPGETESASRELGHEAEASVDWEHGETLAGIEGFLVDSFDNGYTGGRVYARQELGRCFAAVDALVHAFRERVNDEKLAVSGTLTAGVEIAKGFSAVVAGQAGVNPFMERTFQVLAKLVYNQTYRAREVR